MARINVGVNPLYLSDQHLVAESVEITMITGQLEYSNFEFKAEIPEVFPLGTGHMTFFKDKLEYLYERLNSVNSEMINRGFKPGTNIDEFIMKAPNKLLNNWSPSNNDTTLIRSRISERLITRKKGTPGQGYYRYNHKLIPDINLFVNNLKNSELFHV